MTVSESPAYSYGPAPISAPLVAPAPAETGASAGPSPVAAFPVGGVLDLRRTQALRLREVDWLPKPHSATRYLPDSLQIRVAGWDLEIIRQPGASLRSILPIVHLELNRLIYLGNRAHPGTFMHLHLANASTLAVVRQGDEVVGFSLATHLDLDGTPVVLHNATAVDPILRHCSLTHLLNLVHLVDAFCKTRGGAFFSAARTHNPLIYGAMVSSGLYYPKPDRPPSPEVMAVARAVATYLNPRAVFDDALMVQRRAWKKVLDGTSPRHRREDVNSYCDRHLRIADGDGLVVVGKFTLSTMARAIWRSTWKQITPHFDRF